MSLKDRIGYGFTLKFVPVAGGAAVTLSIVEAGTSESSSKAIANTSKLADGDDTFLGGSKDGGNIDCTVAYHPGSAEEIALLAWYAAMGQDGNTTVTLSWPEQGEEAAGTSEGQGILASMGRAIARNELATRELSIKKTGPWVDAEEA